jgi:hypothetical protein
VTHSSRPIPEMSWQPLNIAAGNFANYGAPFPVCEFAMDPWGMVHVRGLCSYTPGGGPYAAWNIAQLPAWAFPKWQEIFTCIGSYSGGQIAFRVDVLQNGVIQGSAANGVNYAAPGYQSLSGIRYQAVGH